MLQNALSLFESVLVRSQSFWLLALRLVLAKVFLLSGYGKLTHLDGVIEFFGRLGIPFPGIQAPVVSAMELVAGGLILLGILARPAALSMIGVMVVAICTAKAGDIHSLSDLVEQTEFLYILLLGIVASFGPGALSGGRFLAKEFERKFAPRTPVEGRGA